MHQSDMLWWKYCREKYEPWFVGATVIEFGSLNINGSVRHLFDPDTYIGVDRRPGKHVDVVALAGEFQSPMKFKTVISSSMLEHDTKPALSLNNMIGHLAPDGGLFLTWGAARCEEHCLEASEDGEFHALPAGRVLNYLAMRGMYVHEFRYQSRQFPEAGTPTYLGFVSLVAFWSRNHAVGEEHIDELLSEDKE